LQNEKFTLDKHSVLHVEEFISVGGDTSGIEFKNGSYISTSPISGTQFQELPQDIPIHISKAMLELEQM